MPAAEEQVGARAAGERVVAGAAEQVGRRQCAVGLVERIVSLPARPKTWIRAYWRPSVCRRHGDRAAVDQDLAGGIAADGDRVVERVTETVSTPELNVAVTAALAVPAVPAIRPAATTLPASSRRAARLQPVLCRAFIVSSFQSTGRQNGRLLDSASGRWYVRAEGVYGPRRSWSRVVMGMRGRPPGSCRFADRRGRRLAAPGERPRRQGQRYATCRSWSAQ